MEKINLIKKQIRKDLDGFTTTEERWFVETGDGFDGTAQGYGYKTPQAVYKAYNYYKSKHKRHIEKNTILKFLKENPDIKNCFESYFGPQECVWRIKDQEDDSLIGLIENYKDEDELHQKLKLHEDFLKKVFKYYLKN